ncbi:MAG: isoprenyl transferase [Candidatus Glassbacteria bacterium]|nr:isoprenyl transferase [Candidatus Glassbacteria bacterium]
MSELSLKERVIAGGNIPHHVAIIMDGNGRWAQERGKPRVFGHQHGMHAVRDVVEGCREIGCAALTLYAFSEENWKRPAAEIKVLMRLLRHYIERERENLKENDIRLQCLGRMEKVAPAVRGALVEAMEYTADCSSMVLNLAISYSSRSEIVDAVREISRRVAAGSLDPGEIDEETVARSLYTRDLPDPDLLIRTSGEFRVSNFLLWQIAYTEIYITSVLWPDFRKPDLYQAVLDYQKRERRFGMVKSTV